MKNKLADRIRAIIREVPDFPEEGISFKDITPVLEDGETFHTLTRYFAEQLYSKNITKIVGIESRGFIFGAAVAHEMQTGLVLARKPGKLPRTKIGVDYDLEYGTDRIEIHADALDSSDRVAIVDDVLATGGTASATAEVVKATGATIEQLVFLIELEFLNGREKLAGEHIHSLIKY